MQVTLRGFCHIRVGSGEWAGTAYSGFRPLSSLGWAQTQDPGSACTVSRSRVAPSEKGPAGPGGSHPGQRQGHSIKVPSCRLCSKSRLHSPESPAGRVSRKAPDGVLMSRGLQQQLGMGRPAGAAAGFAVVPMATEVHFDGQCTVGAGLVLAAVIWGLCGTRL